MSRSDRGSVSVAVVTALLPMMVLLVSLVVETGQFFSVLHSIQEAVDSESQHALARRQSTASLKAAVQSRIGTLGVHAEILSITDSAGSRARRVSVQGRYRGPVLTVIGDLAPAAPLFIPFSVEAVVRGLSAASLVLLDSTVPVVDVACTDSDLLRMERFAERVVTELQARSEVRVIGGVLPSGRAGLRELSLTSVGSDGVARCNGSELTSGPSARFAIKGDIPASIDVATLSAEVTALLTARVLSGPDEMVSIALVLRERLHRNGAAAALLDAIDSEARRQKRRVLALVVFTGAPMQYQERVNANGRYGVEVRRIFGPSEALESASFVHAAVSMMSDRIVVAQ